MDLSQKGGFEKPAEGLGARKKLLEDIQYKAADQGVAKISSDIDKAAAASESLKINIGVTGQSGSGKSSLVNTLRSLKSTEIGAAKTGTVETTEELRSFPHPANANILIWDMPGVGTNRFPQESYVETVTLDKFDFLIICTATRFKKVDAWLMKECKKHGIPFCLVRTKIDIDTVNEMEENEVSEDEVLEHIRNNIHQELCKDDLQEAPLYLISTKFKLQTKFDFPKLTQYIMNNTRTETKSSLFKVMVSSSISIINDKNQALKKQIKNVAKRAAASPKSYEQIAKKEITNYTEWFGLSRKALAKFDINMNKLGGDLFQIQKSLQAVIDEPIEESTTGEEVGSYFSIIGWAIGVVVDSIVDEIAENRRQAKIEAERKKVESGSSKAIYTCVENSLTEVLEQCTRLALAVLEQKKEKVSH